MDISNWTVEDFVLDQGFVDDVLNPTTESRRYWEALLEKNAHKKDQASQARVIVLRMKASGRMADHDRERLWESIQDQILVDTRQPLDRSWLAKAGLHKKRAGRAIKLNVPQIYRVAAILWLTVGLAWIVNLPKEWVDEIIHPE